MSVRCMGTNARYALRCARWTSHPSRTCGLHRGQVARVARFPVDVGTVTVRAHQTPTRWAVIEYERVRALDELLNMRRRRRYVADVHAALAVKWQWVAELEARQERAA